MSGRSLLLPALSSSRRHEGRTHRNLRRPGAVVAHLGDKVSIMVNDAFKALAHPIRRVIVERLSNGPATVGEATAGLGVSKPAISRHVKVLEEAGVVVRRIHGRTHRLGLDPVPLAEAVDWIDHQRAVWERMFDAVDEYLEARKESP